MIHLDLFSGIGGFSYAVDRVFGRENITHIFCDNNKFCQAVIKKHWPDSEHWSDIRELIAHATKSGLERKAGSGIQRGGKGFANGIDILTGGFPCQPFSQAGKRRGKSDDRFLWPEMLECIRLFKPSWVVAENVHGILNIEGGMVFEQVCSELEGAGYEVWPFIVPACAINAPHRRDRVWIVAHSNGYGSCRCSQRSGMESQQPTNQEQSGNRWASKDSGCDREHDAPNTSEQGLQIGQRIKNGCGAIRQKRETFAQDDWQFDWKQVALATCIRRVDDGIPGGMDNVSPAKHRTERLKMLGNAIVPQVAVEIMSAIKRTEEAVK